MFLSIFNQQNNDLSVSLPHGHPSRYPTLSEALDFHGTFHQGIPPGEEGKTCEILCIDHYTLQGINISHLGKRKLIFKTALERDMLVPRRVSIKMKEFLSWTFCYNYIFASRFPLHDDFMSHCRFLTRNEFKIGSTLFTWTPKAGNAFHDAVILSDTRAPDNQLLADSLQFPYWEELRTDWCCFFIWSPIW